MSAISQKEGVFILLLISAPAFFPVISNSSFGVGACLTSICAQLYNIKLEGLGIK
jgi:hypothetical protein